MNSIKIKKVEVFSIIINDEHFGEFHVESEWEGFKKLTNDKGNVIIITSDLPDNLINVFDIGEYKIVKASSDIQLAIKHSLQTKETE